MLDPACTTIVADLFVPDVIWLNGVPLAPAGALPGGPVGAVEPVPEPVDEFCPVDTPDVVLDPADGTLDAPELAPEPPGAILVLAG